MWERRRSLKDHVQKGGKRIEWLYHSFTSSSLTGDHNPPSFRGPATMRDDSAATSLLTLIGDSPPLSLNLFTCPAYRREQTVGKDSETRWVCKVRHCPSRAPAEDTSPWPSREEWRHLAAPAGSKQEHLTAA